MSPFRYINSRNWQDPDLDPYNEPRSNVNMLIESLYATSYLIAKLMLILA